MQCSLCCSAEDTPSWVIASRMGHNLGVRILGNGTANPDTVCILVLNNVKTQGAAKNMLGI